MTTIIETPCNAQVIDGNSVEPGMPTCELAQGHAGPHHYICWAESFDSNVDDPIFAYCKLPAFHAGRHEWTC